MADTRPICVSCGERMTILKNGVKIAYAETDLQRADLIECPVCGYRALVGMSLPEFNRNKIAPDIELPQQNASVYERIGYHIRVAREERKMSQDELARHLGFEQSTITRYEKGQRKISLDDLSQLAKVLHKPMDYFVGDTRALATALPPRNHDPVGAEAHEPHPGTAGRDERGERAPLRAGEANAPGGLTREDVTEAVREALGPVLLRIEQRLAQLAPTSPEAATPPPAPPRRGPTRAAVAGAAANQARHGGRRRKPGDAASKAGA